MTLQAKIQEWFSPQRLISAKGLYFVIAVVAAAFIASMILWMSTPTFQLHFTKDPKVEAHLAKCQGCFSRGVNVIWNHMPASSDRAAHIQRHLDECASCQQYIRKAVLEHDQLVAPLGNKSRWGVAVPSRSK